MSNLALNLVRTAARLPDKAAILLDDLTVTYRVLDDATARMATLLQSRGIEPGDRIALMLPNLPSFPVIFYGALRAGAVVVPMNPLFKEREVEYYLSDSGAKIIFGMPGEAEAGAKAAEIEFQDVPPAGLGELLQQHEPDRSVIERAPDDTAVILYTSGTTGKPKGAELTHYGLDRNQKTVTTTLLQITDADVVMGCLPLFHVFGMNVGMNPAFDTGATLTLIPRFDPDKALTVIERDKVTLFEGVPTMYAAMLGAAANHPADLSSLRVCASGGASLPVEVLRKFEETFGAIILEGYGLSETSPVASFNHPDRDRKTGSIGQPIAGVEMKLVAPDGTDSPSGEIGEIAIRGENVMKGYWHKPEATADVISADGWFRTGDLARVDEDGFFFIVDRKKDMIIRGGLNVYPREVEEVLYEHPGIAEAAVLGVPDEMMGEEIAAFVVAKPGVTLDPAEVRQFVKDKIAAYKYPRKVEVLGALPKTATGKILKREIKASLPR